MRFRLLLPTRAESDLDAQVDYLKEFDARAATRWLDRTLDSIAGLVQMPRRFGIVREGETGDRELRQLVVGRLGRTHRILFEVCDDPAEVRVYAVLASAQDDLPASEIEGAEFPDETAGP